MRLPFMLFPSNWGLKGVDKERAYAKHTLSGLELDLEMCRINNKSSIHFDRARNFYGEISDSDLAKIEIEFKIDDESLAKTIRGEYEVMLIEHRLSHGEITEKEHDYALAELRDDEGTMLGVKHKHGELTDNEFTRQMADLRGDPWVVMTDLAIEGNSSAVKSFSLDWNSVFIKNIRNDGFDVPNDDDCVDLWLTDFSRKLALEELNGSGVFSEEADFSYELKRKRLSGESDSDSDSESEGGTPNTKVSYK